MTRKRTKCSLLYPVLLTLALLISDSCMAAEKLNDKKLPAKNAKESASVSQTPDAPELKAMTVVGEAENDPNDPYNKSYTVTNSSTVTKTDTPLMETPQSINVVPRAVMEDQKTGRIIDALENVSGVRAQNSLGTGNNFIVRGFENPNIYRNGLRANNRFRQEYDTANLQSIEVLKGPAQLYG
jgi:iron complex outermembrane receptor protein